MSFLRKATVAALFAASAQLAMASPFTSTSPTGFDVTTVGASTVGGIVVQLIGINGVTVTSQLAASSLFLGQPNFTPFQIGSQTGYGDAVTGALGGGLVRALFRFSLFDGDSALGDFDFNQNFLQVNNVEVGNWSSVQAQNTDGLGVALVGAFSNGGFRNNLLDTGWFDVTNATQLASIFTNIDASNTISFQLRDIDPGDNFFDFRRGIDNSLINVGTGPIVTPPTGQVPEPSSLALVGLALALTSSLALRKKQK